MTDKCYSLDGETFFQDIEDVLYEADEEIKPGDTYYEAERIPMTAERIVSMYAVESLMEDFDANVYDEAGEMPSMPFENIDKAYLEELRQLLIGWVNKRTKLSQYYRVGTVVKKTFTEEDLE